jgi:putative membrane protein
MSIRDFTPRANRRRGQSQRSKAFLAVVLAAAILLQIPYPLLDGRALEIFTLLTVYCGAAAMLLHARLSFGNKFALTYLAITAVFAWVIETIGVNTGWPFGIYEYSKTLGVFIFDVPLVVLFAWTMMAYPALIAARRIARGWVFLYGGAILMGWDLFLDPQMVAAGRWTWEVTGASFPYAPEIPLSNPFGWLLSGLTLIAILHFILPTERRKEAPSTLAVDIFLGWSLVGGFIAQFFFFDRQGLALVAFLIYGAILAPYFFTQWLNRS